VTTLYVSNVSIAMTKPAESNALNNWFVSKGYSMIMEFARVASIIAHSALT
jgi:hypothetical protein